jgi:hypothetical protein
MLSGQVRPLSCAYRTAAVRRAGGLDYTAPLRRIVPFV